MRKVLFAILIVVAGCAPQAKTYMLDGETASISARGGTIHDHGQITKAMLQEAARQARQRGYNYFQVLQTNDRSSSAVLMPGPTTYVNTGGGTVIGLPSPGTAAVRPAGEIMVRFFKQRPDAPNVWEASAVLAH